MLCECADAPEMRCTSKSDTANAVGLCSLNAFIHCLHTDDATKPEIAIKGQHCAVVAGELDITLWINEPINHGANVVGYHADTV